MERRNTREKAEDLRIEGEAHARFVAGARKNFANAQQPVQCIALKNRQPPNAELVPGGAIGPSYLPWKY